MLSKRMVQYTLRYAGLCILLLALSLLSLVSLNAAEDDEEELAKRKAHWKQVMNYGIDSEVSDLLSQITEYNDANYTEEALQRFNHSNNRELQLSIITYLKAVQPEAGKELVENVILDYLSYDDAVVEAMLGYAEVNGQKSSKMLNKIEEMLYSDDLQAPAIRTLGKLGGSAQLSVLLEAYEDNADNTDMQAEILLAIGNLELAESKDFLYPIAEGVAQSVIIRQYAIDALAKSVPGDPEVAKLLHELMTSSQEWIRAYTVYALRFFPSEETNRLIANALRDEFWRVRVFALQSITALNLSATLDAVVYKTHYDPEIPVRKEAVITLAELDTANARKALFNIVSNISALISIRATAVEKLLQTKLSASEQKELLAVIEEEWGNAPLIKHISRTISRNDNKSVQGIAQKLLDYPDVGVQIGSIKAIEQNKFRGLTSDLNALLESTSFPLVRSYATEAISILTIGNVPDSENQAQKEPATSEESPSSIEASTEEVPEEF